MEVIITNALRECRQAAAKAAMLRASIIAAMHSQYPIHTDYDRGYAQGRQDAARAIREAPSPMGGEDRPKGESK
ncbi:hypothetical protein [Sphingomonas mollis]|uniref:Uncharacterized protein n=1 Tax=Sphingomonas mollis TaxID=2795726 RepID=A0ABS0XLJ4_9SPHN|nr:hypothetical protein [Sphingomonas sp. BT553]MBJ6120895.1 hypothetical protein [Sphingomonas sp. BT553]